MQQNEAYKTRWDDRYRETAYAYGQTPNVFFKTQLDKLQPGRLLLPAEGEGRNGIYAASQGWQVSAFDISEEGRKKAILLAHEKNVTLDYQVGDLEELDYEPTSFDVVALIYAHCLADKKAALHRGSDSLLKPGGIILLEAFSKNHLPLVTANPAVGGPKEAEMLYSVEEIRNSFTGYKILLLEETLVELQEGQFHNGVGSVVRFVGKKA